jgi:hypothetical protein
MRTAAFWLRAAAQSAFSAEIAARDLAFSWLR